MEQTELFEAYLAQEEKSALTIEKYTRDVRHFLFWLQDEELNKHPD